MTRTGAKYFQQDNSFGRALRKWRLDNGIKRKDLAELFNVKPPAIGEYEKGRTRLRQSNFDKLPLHLQEIHLKEHGPPLADGARGNSIPRKPPLKTGRPCLHCQRKFRSEGIHNWICDPCKKTDVFQSVTNDCSFRHPHRRTA